MVAQTVSLRLVVTRVGLTEPRDPLKNLEWASIREIFVDAVQDQRTSKDLASGLVRGLSSNRRLECSRVVFDPW